MSGWSIRSEANFLWAGANDITGRGILSGAPGGEVAVFSTTQPPYRIEAVRLGTGERKVLTAGTRPYYTLTGHLVFGSAEGQILAAPFDAERMELTGPAVPLVEGVGFTLSLPTFSLSQNGTLVYLAGAGGAGEREFVWVTRSGQATPVDAGWSFVTEPNPGWSLSPDGTRLVLKDETEAGADIWVKQLPDGPRSRLTFGEGRDLRLRWAPDGESVTFLSNRSGNWDVWSRRADGTGEPQVLFDGGSLLNQGQAFWSPVGEWLVLRTGGTGRRDILALRPGVDSVPLPLLTEEYDEQSAALSPDGSWLAYVSTETGSEEVFVRPFPNVDSGRWQVSTDGGIMPVWAHSGRELFYVDGSRVLVAVQVETDPSFQVGATEVLFTIPPGYRTSRATTLYDITPDDQRFLMARLYQGAAQEEAGPQMSLILVQNFVEELKARVPR